MQVYLIILILCSFINFAFSQEPEGRLIKEHDDGTCTYEIIEQEYEPVEVSYTDFQTYFGRCRGYYFRRCVNERMVIKTRIEDRLNSKTRQINKCCHGYIQTSFDKCLPVCEFECVQANCTAPNVCTCHDGFKPHGNETHICEPECTGCDHGTCIAPNLCQCNMGYDWDSNRAECVPFCSGECHNGKCVAPEQCDCDDGLVHHNYESLCIPHCNEECINGYCAEPNKCVCADDYKFVNDSSSICEPICTMPCINSKCIEPNTCECHDGYKVHDDDKPHECSCGHYCAEVDGKCHCLDEKQRVSREKLLNDAGICNKTNCINGHCVSPTHCECFDGFDKDEHSICAPVNETCIDDPKLCNGTDVQGCDCLNGICSANGTCVCLNGFQMVAGRTDRCEPHCSKECVHGVCIDPDICLCENENDYHLSYNETEWNICHPICDRDIDETNGCYNGTCVSPGECQCFEGFELDPAANFTCIPITFSAEKTRYSTISVIAFSFLLTAVLLSTAAVAYFVILKLKQKQLANSPDGKINSQDADEHIQDDSTSPIAYEPSEEL